MSPRFRTRGFTCAACGAGKGVRVEGDGAEVPLPRGWEHNPSHDGVIPGFRCASCVQVGRQPTPVSVSYMPGFEPRPASPAAVDPPPPVRTRTPTRRRVSRLSAEVWLSLADLLCARPERPDSAIAEDVGVSAPTVRGLRRRLEAADVIPTLAYRIDASGRRRPAKFRKGPAT